MRTFLSAYPWDLVDEGIDAALDRMRGELGAGGITLLSTSPAFVGVRDDRFTSRVVRSRGGVLFKPVEDHYASTRCKPVVSSHVRGSDSLNRVSEACADRGLALRLAVHGATIGRMAEKYPQAATRNALDDTSHSSLCLNNPDVQALLIGLVTDASGRPGVDGVELRDAVCVWHEAFDPTLRAVTPLTDTIRLLLSLCFCESCHQRADQAGVDAASVKRFVQVELDNRMSGEASDTAELGSIVEQSRPLAQFLSWRATERVSLLNRLSAASGGRLIVRQPESTLKRACYPLLAEDGSYAIAHERDAVDEGSDRGSPKEDPKGAYAIRFAPRSAACGAALVRIVSELASAGATAVTLDAYGDWNASALTMIKQALRFGRRSAT